ncbi:MAG: fused MFS/spermidine synthase [Fimbriimonadaceae bacterium]|nr:fused MFS/spermidine synthase [Fimbriimonadaceae bacterium]
MVLFSSGIFLSAFLLFLVQPLIGRYVLPWYGGSTMVWSTCLLFFQVLLVGGYGYADALIRYVRPARQVWIHAALLILAAATLPITPNDAWKPSGSANPVLSILWLLTRTVGLPYLALSSTGPLVQAWFARAFPGRPPYRLYALSNFGSFLALLAYPALLEPALRLGQQTQLWSLGFAVYALLCAAIARRASQAPELPVETADQDDTHLTFGRLLLWLSLPACGTALLMSMTNQICQDVAAVPLLWILPLALYLLSLVISFEREAWYARPVWSLLLAVSLSFVSITLLKPFSHALAIQVLILCGGMFVGCMACHGELVRLRPGSRYLTLFYLVMAIGGALGGAFVALLAPVLFSNHWELHATLLLLCLLLGIQGTRDMLWATTVDRRWEGIGLQTVAVVGGALLIWMTVVSVRQKSEDALLTQRNFYGVLRVVDRNADDLLDHRRVLYNGQIMHGLQYQAEARREVPTTYYGEDSGIGLSCLTMHRLRQGPLTIGCLGLGTGSLAVYTNPGDRLHYYEINPLCVDVAEHWFSYLSDARRRGADTAIHLGDARIYMERQLAAGESMQFDILALDAFTGDAIPIHLLTTEAFALYWQHLKPDGVLAVHVSNRYLRLAPVVRRLATAHGCVAFLIDQEGDDAQLTTSSEWVLVTRSRAFQLDPEVLQHCSDWPAPPRRVPLWSDDYSNLLQVLRKMN